MAVIELSGTVTGTGSVPALAPVKLAILGEGFGGAAVVTAKLIRTMMFGGQAFGFGEMGDHLTVQLDGTVTGQGSLTASLYRTLVAVPLPCQGRGSFIESCPEPAIGYGRIVGEPFVERVPCPLAYRPIVPTFRWGQDFPPGELMIAFTDAVGNPWAPVVVLFRLFRVMPGGPLYPVGPFNRRPVACRRRLGVYYVVGTAGEGGQPGDWVIEWRWQRSPYDPPTIERRPFKVLDAVLAGDTSTCRCTKYGWDD